MSAVSPSHEAPPVVSPQAAESAEVVAMDRTIREQQVAYDIVRSLTTEVGPRLSGSSGDKLAVLWALRTMNALGFKNVHAEAVKVPVWVRGIETAAVVAPLTRPLAVTALGWSGATPVGGVTAPVVRFTSLAALEGATPEQLRGKIAFLDVRMEKSREGEAYEIPVRGRFMGAGHARAKGAAAFLLRSVGTDHSRAPHTGVMRKSDPGDDIAGGALSSADADLLARLLASNAVVQLHLDIEPRVEAMADSANVVGEVTGREHPEEIVLLGAHLDSWDLGEGAVDDGAGCAITMGAAFAVSKLPAPPRRTIRVVLFAAEETSGAGAEAYAVLHASEARNIVVAAEADSGSDRVFRLRGVVPKDGVDELHALGRLLLPLGISSDDEAAWGGADVSKLRPFGVPLLSLYQDVSHYFDVHHTAEDTLAQVDPAAIAQATSAFARVAWASAESVHSFGRLPPDAGVR